MFVVVVLLLLFFGLLDFLLGFLFVCLDRLGLFGVVLFFFFWGGGGSGGRGLVVGFGGGGSLVVAFILLCPSRKASSLGIVFLFSSTFPFSFLCQGTQTNTKYLSNLVLTFVAVLVIRKNVRVFPWNVIHGLWTSID